MHPVDVASTLPRPPPHLYEHPSSSVAFTLKKIHAPISVECLLSTTLLAGGRLWIAHDSAGDCHHSAEPGGVYGAR